MNNKLFERAKTDCLITCYVRNLKRDELKQAEIKLSDSRLALYKIAGELGIDKKEINYLLSKSNRKAVS